MFHSFYLVLIHVHMFCKIVDATKKLSIKSGDRLAQLRILRQGFSQGTALIDAFIR